MSHMTNTTAIFHPAARRTTQAGFVAKTLNLLSLWKSRRDLAKLAPEMLDDIGVTKLEATRESDRPLWDVPETWRR